MKESMMNMTKKTMVYGMGGTFLALALILGACQQPTGSSGENGSLGRDETLVVSGTVYTLALDTYTAITDASANGSVTATGLAAFAGTIKDGKLNGSISGSLSGINTPLTKDAAGTLIKGGLTSAADKFTNVNLSVEDAKYVELKLQSGGKNLSNEEITSDEAVYFRYVFVTQDVTITATGASNFSITKPTTGGGTAAMKSENLNLVLKEGWNVLYESYDLRNNDSMYTFECYKDWEHWVLKN
jgi:hypothetical protein